MELTKELKEKLENVKSKEEAMKIIGESGIELTDDDLDQVSGGGWFDDLVNGLRNLGIDI